MSVLTQAIQAALSPVTGSEPDGYSARITFPTEFVGFKGHFPGRPVLPGVCLIQTALVALSRALDQPVELKRLVSAKWMMPVLPGEEIVLSISLKQGERSLSSARVLVMRGTGKVAEFSLEVVVAP
jgi:3-hydroxymyristoyl/3-hydroxydecanoyl-(acyl carrier protein) dehydratase